MPNILLFDNLQCAYFSLFIIHIAYHEDEIVILYIELRSLQEKNMYLFHHKRPVPSARILSLLENISISL